MNESSPFLTLAGSRCPKTNCPITTASSTCAALSSCNRQRFPSWRKRWQSINTSWENKYECFPSAHPSSSQKPLRVPTREKCLSVEQVQKRLRAYLFFHNNCSVLALFRPNQHHNLKSTNLIWRMRVSQVFSFGVCGDNLFPLRSQMHIISSRGESG